MSQGGNFPSRKTQTEKKVVLTQCLAARKTNEIGGKTIKSTDDGIFSETSCLL